MKMKMNEINRITCSNRNDVVDPLVSVIVPVYNTEMYLKQCISSLRKQTLKEIEIILIDDGSTDRSGVICDEVTLNDPRFRVIHKQNEGLSAARNDGIQSARAKYIMTVDSDDWVEPEFCQLPYEVAEKYDRQVVGFPYRTCKGHKGQYEPSATLREGLIPAEAALTEHWADIAVNAWCKLYRRELFQDVCYPVGRLAEDLAVTHHLIDKAGGIYWIDRPLYNYRIDRPGSITTERSHKYLVDEAHLQYERIKDLASWGYIKNEEIVNSALNYLMIAGQSATISEECRTVVRNAKSLSESASWKQRLMFRMFTFSPTLFELVVKVTGRRA